MLLSIRWSDLAQPGVSKDVNRLINRKLHWLSNDEDENSFQPTDVKPFVGKHVSNTNLPS